MTNGFFSILHPTFESLSACADMSELDTARSRVGRHVSRCADCQEVVDDIRRLGDEARITRAERAPDDLWSRIANASVQAAEEQAKPRETPPPEATPWEAAPSLKPTRHWPIPAHKSARIGLGLAIAAAAAIVAVLAWPGGQSLEASGLSRLTFSPARPVPGGMMTIRYQPAAWLEGAPRLVLVGNYSSPAGHNPSPWYYRESLGDSIATLLPARDGSYEARVRLPKDFLAMQLAVRDSTGDNGDADGWFPWGVIAGEPSGAPSLRALLSAQETFRESRWGEGAARHNARINVADSLKRYFPAHPAGWAFSSGYGTQKGVFSFLRFFQNAESKYLSLYEKLWDAPALDADRLHDMVAFAWRIEEPAQAELWAKRLAREHPDDPRALFDLAAVLHGVELRQPKGLADSIRPWFPLLDSLYRRSPQTEIRNTEVGSLAERYGDSATKALWRSRAMQNVGVQYAYEARSDAEIRALSPALLQRVEVEARKSCARPVGKFSLFSASSRTIDWCQLEKSRAARTLAHVALLDGNPRGALALADSSLAFGTQGFRCTVIYGGPYPISARARLALGDTIAAERDLIAGAPFDWRIGAYTDSVRATLGSRFDAARWKAELDSSRAALTECARLSKLKSDSVAAKNRERARQ
jgi:hypothetical protein